jgi:tetratricopeptide (TPR) repeat protein
MKKTGVFKYIPYWLITLICINWYSCSLMPDKLKTAEQLIEASPDSALRILQQLSPREFSFEADKALYGLLLFRALDKKLLPLKPDSLLSFSLNYYQRHHDKVRLAYCLLYKGRSDKYALRYDDAMDSYLKAYDLIQYGNYFLLLGRINSDIGDIHNIQKDYTLARKKYKLAYQYFTKLKLQSLAFNSLLDIGRTYHTAKEYHTAQHYYRTAFRQVCDSIQYGALLQEIAINHYENKQYDSALLYFRKVISYPYILNNRAIRYYYVADLFSDLQQIDSAGYYAKRSFSYNPDIRTRRECYRILTNVAYTTGDKKMMSVYMNRYVEISDSLRKIDAQTKGSVLETMHETRQKFSNTKLERFYLFGLLLLFVTIGCFIFILTRKKIQKEKLRIEEIHQQQKIMIRKEVVDKQRKALSKRMEEIKATQAKERKNSSSAMKDAMDRELYNQLLHLNDVEYFDREMDVLLNNMVSKLKNRYPSITDKEKTWCCLHLLCVPSTDILMLFNYKVDSLNKMKQRLAQKVQLNGVAEIDNFLNELLSQE